VNGILLTGVGTDNKKPVERPRAAVQRIRCLTLLFTKVFTLLYRFWSWHGQETVERPRATVGRIHCWTLLLTKVFSLLDLRLLRTITQTTRC